MVSSGRVEKSPHEQEIKFFAKVSYFAFPGVFLSIVHNRGIQRTWVISQLVGIQSFFKLVVFLPLDTYFLRRQGLLNGKIVCVFESYNFMLFIFHLVSHRSYCRW